jgi:uncharacterized iron-regulated membrane protein
MVPYAGSRVKKTFRLSMIWLHTWIGLLPGWLLYAIFLTGTASYFRPEITTWMQPEAQARAASAPAAMRLALDTLAQAAPDAQDWYIELPEARKPGLGIAWYSPGIKDGYHTRTLDAAGLSPQVRDTKGGEFFYRFHFQLQLPYPWGRWLACFAAVFMMTALITGVIAHRRFFKDFFTFRPGKAAGRSWLDFHNLAGVLALPFYLMIGYTALVMFLYMFAPWGRLATEPPAPKEAATAQESKKPYDSAVAGKPAAMVLAPLEPMLAEAEKLWGAGEVGRIGISDRKDSSVSISFDPIHGKAISIDSRKRLEFNGILGTHPEAASDEGKKGSASRLNDFLYGLHLAHFADPILRWLFFCMGLLGSAMVATGLILWIAKRRAQKENEPAAGPGFYLVERLNIAVIAGFPLAFGAFFWSNRLLPAAFTGRSDWEVNLVFIVWGIAFLHAFLRPAAKAWKEQLALAAVLYLLLPALDAITAGRFLAQAWRLGNSAHLGFNATAAVVGLFFAYAARRASKAITYAEKVR